MSKDEIPLHVVFVEAWVIKEDKILLAKRSEKDDQAAGCWTAPGGKVEMEVGHNVIEDTLAREVMEEVGIEVHNVRYLSSTSFIRSSGDHVVGMSFAVDYKSGEPQALEDQDEVKWVSLDEARRLIMDYAHPILDKIGELVAEGC